MKRKPGNPAWAKGPSGKGQSGNPGGRPKGAKTLIYSVRELMGERFLANRPKIAEQYDEVLTSKRTVLEATKFAAQLNKEIGNGDGDSRPVTINFITTLDPKKLLVSRPRP